MEYNKYKVSFEIVTEIDNSQKLKGEIDELLNKYVLGDTEVLENLEVKFIEEIKE